MLKFHDCILFGLYSDAKIGPTLQSHCNFSHIGQISVVACKGHGMVEVGDQGKKPLKIFGQKGNGFLTG